MKKKYTFENRIFQDNTTDPVPTLGIVSSINDIKEVTDLYANNLDKTFILAPNVQDNIKFLQKNVPTNLINPVDGLMSIFAKYEVPIGMISKLLALKDYHLYFIVDDSSSMGLTSGIFIENQMECGGVNTIAGKLMTRFEEVQDRIHKMLDMLAYIPTKGITISFLNREEKLIIPGEFSPETILTVKKKIDKIFSIPPQGPTPMYAILEKFLKTNHKDPTMCYLFTDGEPNDAPTVKVKNLIVKRSNPSIVPITLISCTNNDKEVAWLKEVDEEALFTAEIDDFETECKEVNKNQGKAFPFNYGVWLICNLVAAINLKDLDVLDEPIPLSMSSLINYLGYELSENEYKYYFEHHPHKAKYNQNYKELFNTKLTAVEILFKEKTKKSTQHCFPQLFCYKNTTKSNKLISAKSKLPHHSACNIF